MKNFILKKINYKTPRKIEESGYKKYMVMYLLNRFVDIVISLNSVFTDMNLQILFTYFLSRQAIKK